MEADGWSDEMATRTDLSRSEKGPGAGGMAGILLIGLVCPLLCTGPLLVVALASTGLGRVLRGAPWPLVAVAVLVVVALVVGGSRALQARNCCAPASPRLFGDEPTR
jgi:hypothetical protein